MDGTNEEKFRRGFGDTIILMSRKLIVAKKEASKIVLDLTLETADADLTIFSAPESFRDAFSNPVSVRQIWQPVPAANAATDEPEREFNRKGGTFLLMQAGRSNSFDA